MARKQGSEDLAPWTEAAELLKLSDSRGRLLWTSGSAGNCAGRVGLHLLLHQGGYATAAWVASALHLYAVLWLCGDAQAFRLEPIRVERDRLLLRFGLRWSSRIPWPNIARVERTTGSSTTNGKETLRMTLIGQPNVRLSLREPQPVSGLMGMQRYVITIELAVDEPDQFVAEVADRLG